MCAPQEFTFHASPSPAQTGENEEESLVQRIADGRVRAIARCSLIASHPEKVTSRA